MGKCLRKPGDATTTERDMVAGLTVSILLALFGLCMFENPITSRRKTKVDLKRPSNNVRRSYEVGKDGNSIRYNYRGSEIHCIYT